MKFRWLAWLAVVAAIVIPVTAAGFSPLLEWRTPTYIVAGFAGILCLCVMLLQPLLAAGLLPGMTLPLSRRVHSIAGGALVLLMTVHIGGLWITSPPDVVDALLFVSATSFSLWGVSAMWCILASALLVVLRPRFRRRLDVWKLVHKALAAVAVTGTVVHALKIEGAMETITKTALCILVVAVSAWVLLSVGPHLKKWRAGKWPTA